MKNTIKKITFAFLALSIGLQACDKGFIDLNTDPVKTTEAYASQFMANGLLNAVSTNMNRNRSFTNELMQVTVSIGEGDGKVFRYDFRPSWSSYLWDQHYKQLMNFKDMYLKASEEVSFNRSYQGIALLCQSWLFSILTDTYGDVPYSQALLGRDSLILEPRFDEQRTIYNGMFQKFEEANALLKAGEAIDPTADPVFAGDVSKWRKLSNSMYLRLLLRIAHKEDGGADAIKKIKEILEDNTSEYPIMSSNSDVAVLRWTGKGAYVSPFMETRAQDFRATSLASFFIDHLRDWNDPRLNIPEYGTAGINRLGIATVSGNYVGVESGYAAGNAEDYTKMSYFYSYDQNAGVNSLQTEPLTGMIMNYAEVEFIKVEAIIKGWVSGSAETYYKSAVENNIKLWVPNLTQPVQDYLANADIQWDENKTLAQKMQLLHLQKYYALFMVDMQQWFEYRRTGYPILPKGAGLKNNGEMPSRMVYPVIVQSSNPTGYKEAIANQGADLINTKVWWQKP
ncbi:SusD/RagB family nutrient-binding outer membrane lipoprotein [Sphingobacterium sp. SRCM116780]|uniref:SusD/RagB family nutrient-binding outer membrane lipoprotein n=1 Tax=Sphingobacterium sp. SRCM116780 TaxID=2907623 RepID=UPI001F1B0BC7|nr:SusD/RagB family nutrient-binding outer membrane lipoprotein [Sphingobacterium sp. SRCM116780]UIR55903.1 SusD/RagB family nutrient-binding outer membrane lipoprotein [Sphingobacterium sp. SRCM116780]